MVTKIDNFYKLINELRYKFQQILNVSYENFDEQVNEIESIYSKYKNVFPFGKNSFEILYDEGDKRNQNIIWRFLKDSYYNYENYIELEFKYFNNPNYIFSEKFIQLFYHSKTLCNTFFTIASKDYYWYYGRDDKQFNKTILVSYLSDFESDNFEEIKSYYSYQFEIIEKEVKYIYSKHTFTLEISEPKYTESIELNTLLEKLNKEHISKLEILKNYADNITKLSLDLRFDYPDFITDSTVRITFSKPQEVYDCIEPYLSSIILREELKNLIFGEIDIASNKIRINCNQNVFAKFFGELNAKGIIYANNNDDIEEWILRNFQHKKNGQFKNFAKSSVNTFMKPYRDVPESEAIKHPF